MSGKKRNRLTMCVSNGDHRKQNDYTARLSVSEYMWRETQNYYYNNNKNGGDIPIIDSVAKATEMIGEFLLRRTH